MRVSNVPKWMSMAGPITSWINTTLIVLGLGAGAVYWTKSKDAADIATSAQLTALANTVADFKRDQANAVEIAKRTQVESLDKLTKDLTDQLSDIRSKQDSTAGQLQAIQVTNQGFVGRFDLIDQKLTQVSRQVDSVDGRTTSLETRVSKTEADLGVLRALFERLGGRK